MTQHSTTFEIERPVPADEAKELLPAATMMPARPRQPPSSS